MSTPPLSPLEAKKAIIHCFRAGVVPMLHGDPSTSKSSIVAQIGKEANYKVIDLRLSQCEPTDLLGLPNFKDGRAEYLPFNTFPLEGDELPEGHVGWILFLDEFNSCSRSVQAASYKVVLDRMIGQHKLHPKVRIVAAGNLATNNAIVNEMSTAMQSRLVHLEVKMTKDDWMDWALNNGIDSRITTYIEYRPSHLHRFNPDHADRTYPCARTWEFVSKLIKGGSLDTRELLPVIQGSIGEGTGLEFFNFCALSVNLPSIKEIEADPSNTPIPAEASHKYAMVGVIIEGMNTSNASKVFTYLTRLSMEYQYMALRSVIKSKPVLLNTPEIKEWVNSNANRFYS